MNPIEHRPSQFVLAFQATYGNKELISRQTARLIITTPFGGTETEKVQAQFNKIKDTTDTRISAIDSVLNQQQSKVNSLSSDLDGWMGQALSKISTVSDVVAANVTAQEDILSSEFNNNYLTVPQLDILLENESLIL